MNDRPSPTLGSIVIWSIAKGPYSSVKVADRLAEEGFEIEISDTTINQAWRRATGEPVPSYTWTNPRGHRVEVELRKVDVYGKRQKNVREFHRIATGYAPARVLVAECGRRTKTSSRVGYTVRVDPSGISDRHERIELMKIKEMLETRIETLLTNLDGTRVRKVVRTALETELQGFMVRGGVYYVPARHSARLAALQAIFDVLPESYCEVIPVVDEPAMRAMVTRLLLEHTVEDVEGFITLYRPALERQHCTQYLFGKASVEAAALQDRTYAYLADLEIDDGSDEPLWAALDRLAACLGGLDRIREQP